MVGQYIAAKSKINGGVSEVILMTPIKLGRIQNERRSYEERLRSVLENIQARASKGIPTPITKIPTIHFARWFIIRPENYLLYSNLDVIDYYGDDGDVGGKGKHKKPPRKIPKQFDPYPTKTVARGEVEQSPRVQEKEKHNLRSWLVTLILFDGDVKTYGREISTFIQDEVDRIFQNCEDYPEAKNFPLWWQWFRRHQMPTDVFHNAYPGLSVTRIKELELFKQRFDEFVAKVRPHGKEPIEPVDALLDDFIRENQSIAMDFPSTGGVFKTDIIK